MKVGVMGRGSVAQALKVSLSNTHDIRLGVRAPNVDGEDTLGAVAEWADVIILATPWGAEAEVSTAIAPAVAGKTVIDASNPIGMVSGGLDLVRQADTPSLASRLPGAEIVKGFNQIGAEFMARPDLLAHPPVMFFAADSERAKAQAMQLGADAGLTALDGGPLSNARHLESLAMIWIWQALRGPLGRTFGLSLSEMQH